MAGRCCNFTPALRHTRPLCQFSLIPPLTVRYRAVAAGGCCCPNQSVYPVLFATPGLGPAPEVPGGIGAGQGARAGLAPGIGTAGGGGGVADLAQGRGPALVLSQDRGPVLLGAAGVRADLHLVLPLQRRVGLGLLNAGDKAGSAPGRCQHAHVIVFVCVCDSAVDMYGYT